MLFFVHILPSEAGELHQPVVLCGSQPGTGHPFTSNLRLPAFSLSPRIDFVTPALFPPRTSPSLIPESALLRVSEMQCQAHTVCAIWISVFVAKQLASKGFHYKSKSRCCAVVWAVRCVRLLEEHLPTPSQSVHVISSSKMELSEHCSWREIIICFLLLLVCSLFFPSEGRSLPCSVLTTRKLSLCLPSLMINETLCLWGPDEWQIGSVW